MYDSLSWRVLRGLSARTLLLLLSIRLRRRSRCRRSRSRLCGLRRNSSSAHLTSRGNGRSCLALLGRSNGVSSSVGSGTGPDDTSPLRVVVLDPAAVGAADAALAAPRAAAVALLVISADAADAEEDAGEEEAGPRGPDEAEGVGADAGAAAGAVEVLPGLNKGGPAVIVSQMYICMGTGNLRHESSSEGEEAQ
jgi:hypothetical protein